MRFKLVIIYFLTSFLLISCSNSYYSSPEMKRIKQERQKKYKKIQEEHIKKHEENIKNRANLKKVKIVINDNVTYIGFAKTVKNKWVPHTRGSRGKLIFKSGMIVKGYFSNGKMSNYSSLYIECPNEKESREFYTTSDGRINIEETAKIYVRRYRPSIYTFANKNFFSRKKLPDCISKKEQRVKFTSEMIKNIDKRIAVHKDSLKKYPLKSIRRSGDRTVYPDQRAYILPTYKDLRKRYTDYFFSLSGKPYDKPIVNREGGGILSFIIATYAAVKVVSHVADKLQASNSSSPHIPSHTASYKSITVDKSPKKRENGKVINIINKLKGSTRYIIQCKTSYGEVKEIKVGNHNRSKNTCHNVGGYFVAYPCNQIKNIAVKTCSRM